MHALASLNMLGGLVAAPWLGRHADAFGIRRLLAGLLLIDAALSGCSSSPSRCSRAGSTTSPTPRSASSTPR
jgi:MFS family permease